MYYASRFSNLNFYSFFGGVSEAFLIDKIEKGVKQYVVDKDRSKEIRPDEDIQEFEC